MSINACAVNTCNVDAICGYRRTALLNRLLDEKYDHPTPTVKRAGRSPWLARTREDETFQPPKSTEDSIVTVSLTLDGKTFTQSMLRHEELALIMIGNVKVDADGDQPISVNISKLVIE